MHKKYKTTTCGASRKDGKGHLQQRKEVGKRDYGCHVMEESNKGADNIRGFVFGRLTFPTNQPRVCAGHKVIPLKTTTKDVRGAHEKSNMGKELKALRGNYSNSGKLIYRPKLIQNQQTLGKEVAAGIDDKPVIAAKANKFKQKEKAMVSWAEDIEQCEPSFSKFQEEIWGFLIVKLERMYVWKFWPTKISKLLQLLSFM